MCLTTTLCPLFKEHLLARQVGGVHEGEFFFQEIKRVSTYVRHFKAELEKKLERTIRGTYYISAGMGEPDSSSRVGWDSHDNLIRVGIFWTLINKADESILSHTSVHSVVFSLQVGNTNPTHSYASITPNPVNTQIKFCPPCSVNVRLYLRTKTRGLPTATTSPYH